MANTTRRAAATAATSEPAANAAAHRGEGIFDVHVSMVSDSTKYVGRINIEIDESLIYLDEHGNEAETSQFSFDAYNLRQQLTKVCKEYRKYLLLANGNLESGQVGMLLFGAELKIKRTFAAAGTPRRVGEGTYERDTYITDIESVELSDDAMVDDLRASIRENKAMARVAIANPFA